MSNTPGAKSKLSIVATDGEQKEAERADLQQAEEHKLNQGLEAEEQKQEEGRKTVEKSEQQDLNQGMATGTHGSTRHGVNWGPAYQMGLPVTKKVLKDEESEKKSG